MSYFEVVRATAALASEAIARSAPNPDRDACHRTSLEDCQRFCSRMCIGAARRRYRQVIE